MIQLNTIYNEDCLEGMKRISDGSVDMILCDLPYGTTACKWDVIIPFEPLWQQYKRLIRNNGAIVLTASQPFTSALVMSNPEMFRYEWIWEKETGTNFSFVKKQPFKQHENVLVFSIGAAIYFPQMQPKKETTINKYRHPADKAMSGEATATNRHRRYYSIEQQKSLLRYPSSVQKFNRQMGMHPTQKPVALFEYLIKTYTNEGDTVLDNCMGSGTTAIACMITGRNFIGFEKDETYYNKSIDRIEKHKQLSPQLKIAI